MSYPYLKDSSFLQMFDKERLKEQYVKITVLNFSDEKPIQSIEGLVTAGNVNISGDSALRRTMSITVVADNENNDLTNVNNLFSINKKVKVELGLVNTTKYYTDYPIIWYPLGLYIIITPSISHSTSGVTISLTLQDKMCLLNGTCGGIIPASTTFDQYDEIDENGEYQTIQPTVYQIIQELVNHFGGEQLSKIIISDVDTRIRKVMKWVGSNPLYIITATSNADIQYTATLDESKAVAAGSYSTYEYGDDVGYIYTDFVYTSELVGDAGDSVTSILDEIVTCLGGNYEYFYDLDGNFVFQEIKNYLNTSQATVEIENLSNDDYLIDRSKGKAVYVFDDSSLITSYSNAPQFNMIKNDFIVWGTKESASGVDLPCRYHLAIDTKPEVGNTYKVFFYTDPDDNLTKAKCPRTYTSINYFPSTGQEGVFYMDNSTEIIYKWNPTTSVYVQVAVGLEEVTTKDWRQELYLQGTQAEPYSTDSNYYYTELKAEWPKIYDVKNQEFFDSTLAYPTGIYYFLDFIDSQAAIGELNVNNIGRRSKVVTDNDVNCVFEPDVPDLVMLNAAAENVAALRAECEAQGQEYIQVSSSIYSMLVGGGSSNSAYEYVRSLLYQYTSYNESISVTSIPIYYLDVNTRITVRDNKSGIYGDYIISSISFSLDVASTMTINCTRALERF